MPESYQRGTIVVVEPAVPDRPDRGPGTLIDRLGGAAPVAEAPAEQLADLLGDRHVGAVVVDVRGGEQAWTSMRPSLLAPPDGAVEDPPLLLVADQASWPRVLEVLAAGRGDGLMVPCADAELRARIRSVTGAWRAREHERDALARAIHGDWLQVLASVAMRLQLLRRRVVDPAAELATGLDEAIVDLGGVVERLRTLETERRAPVAEAAAPGAGLPHRGSSPGTTPTLWGSPELLSRLSHDLRSPLNAVLGFAQILELGELAGEQIDAVRQIIRAGTRLLELIDEVVDLSRIEAGHLDLSLEPVDVVELVHDATDLMRPAAAEAAVEIALPAAVALDGYPWSPAAGDHPPGRAVAEMPVMADRQRLLQVMLILLSNAVRYNHPGGRVEVTTSAQEGGYVRVAVCDDGPGIAADQLHKVFLPFDRLHADTQRVAGAGLGLPIARGLLARMGGHIAVASASGEGSRFWFELRAAPAPPSEAEIDAVAGATAGEGSAVSPIEVLYIEDNPASLRLVERILARRPGVTMVPAMQGRLGVQLAVQRQPALILLDLHLPDMAGRDVLHALAGDPATAHIPVVVLSARAQRPEDPDIRLEGARAYLTKPFQMDALLALVDGIRHGRYTAPGGETALVWLDQPGMQTLSCSEPAPREV